MPRVSRLCERWRKATGSESEGAEAPSSKWGHVKKVGQVNANGRVETKKVRRVKEVDWPVTVVDTRAKRIARNLWG